MLKQRILSAILLAPPVLAAVWFGGLWFAAVVAVAGAVMGWEWQRMTEGRFALAGRATSALAIVVAFLPFYSLWAALALVLVLALMLLALGRDASSQGLSSAAQWQGAGVLYTCLPVLSLVWLRGGGQSDGDGRLLLLWLLLLVWATDIGAYAFGRLIGGPLLAPRISPKKTWAGLLGGMVSAALTGGWFAMALGSGPWQAAAISGSLAVVAQAGDLGESWVKRHFGVKDSSAIIPGHGGVLDRVDGILAVAPVVVLIVLIQGRQGLPW